MRFGRRSIHGKCRKNDTADRTGRRHITPGKTVARTGAAEGGPGTPVTDDSDGARTRKRAPSVLREGFPRTPSSREGGMRAQRPEPAGRPGRPLPGSPSAPDVPQAP
ncbi:hypothetical protein GCM10009560_08200 [Nonomuraea longicatena]|uniref:Uncharacterized protein n=1 Tax=Nonomuraea longicatena TaxID=83682 RepID=A0ABN1NQN7_9ACTN